MSNAAEEPTLILGIGSPFGADRAGWEAVALLRGAALPEVRLEISDRPGARLVGLLEGVQRAILIDALACDAAPGTLHRLDLDALAPGDRVSNHGFGVAEALSLARALGTLPPRLGLIGISAAGDHPPPIDFAQLTLLVLTMLQDISKRDG